MSNFKMVCLDIDGTLLNSKHQITAKTKEVLKVVAKVKNIPVVLVSARMPKGIIFLQEELEICEPIICYSGSLILDKKRNGLSSQSIDTDSAKKLHKLVKDTKVHMSLYKDDEWYIEEMDEWAKQESEITNIIPNVVNFNSLFDAWHEAKVGPNKILCMSKPDNILALNSAVNSNHAENLNIYPSKPTYLEIMSKKASKTSAIDFLCKKLNIDNSEVIAMGDNYNDMDMLQFAGMGIAMGNAPDKVKAIANEITFTNDEDGVAVAIEKYVLQGI
jgi:Cof subfamily protein (haloacid dehalogenase superfamily)